MGALAFYLVAFGPFFYYDQVFYNPDHFIGSYVFFETYFRGFSQTGSFPLWNPYHQMGVSSAANPIYGVLYPVHYLQLLLGPMFYFRFGWALHVILLGSAFRRWIPQERTIVSLILSSSLAYLFLSSNFVFLYSITWSVWLISELDSPSLSRWRLALFTALLVTTGEPFTLLIVFSYVFFRLFSQAQWKLFGVVFASAFFTACLVFGPALMVAKYSSRSGGLSGDEALAFSFHPKRLLTLISPYFYGYHPYRTFNPSSPTNDSPYFPRFYFDTIYLSLPLIAFLLLSVKKAVGKKDWPLFAAVGLALAIGFGKWGLMPWLHSYFPFSMLRHPEKAMSAFLLLLLVILVRYLPSWEELRESRQNFIVLFFLSLVPFFSFRHEWTIGACGLLFVFTLFLFSKHKISLRHFTWCALGIGLLQSYLAFPKITSISESLVAERSPVAERILKVVEPGGWQRVEFAPGCGVDGFSHRALVGVNSLYSRGTLSGYEAIETPFLYQAGNRMLGPASRADREIFRSPISPEEMAKVFQLTNLRLIVGPQNRLTPYLSEVVNSSLINVEATEGHQLITPKATPQPLHWFRNLSAGNELLAWPPQFDSERQFWSGVERPSRHQPSSEKECLSNVNEIPFDEGHLKKIDDNRWRVRVEAPCSGWVFLSSNLFPGWALWSKGQQIPLRRLNGTFVGFYIDEGQFEGELIYSPYQALFRQLIR